MSVSESAGAGAGTVFGFALEIMFPEQGCRGEQSPFLGFGLKSGAQAVKLGERVPCMVLGEAVLVKLVQGAELS